MKHMFLFITFFVDASTWRFWWPFLKSHSRNPPEELMIGGTFSTCLAAQHMVSRNTPLQKLNTIVGKWTASMSDWLLKKDLRWEWRNDFTKKETTVNGFTRFEYWRGLRQSLVLFHLIYYFKMNKILMSLIYQEIFCLNDNIFADLGCFHPKDFRQLKVIEVFGPIIQMVLIQPMANLSTFGECPYFIGKIKFERLYFKVRNNWVRVGWVNFFSLRASEKPKPSIHDPWGIHGTKGLYTYMNSVNLYGKLVGKYTKIVPWILVMAMGEDERTPFLWEKWTVGFVGSTVFTRKASQGGSRCMDLSNRGVFWKVANYPLVN